ncbi:MAG TPA: carboxypeptidase-like regulatory domain-containing protein [Candidatus Thermoplasmatota archaeon]|nr:carboxypeptidase-like regulatory domain-containing protein [Candidatus Thermoplasmatota archaeon]
MASMRDSGPGKRPAKSALRLWRPHLTPIALVACAALLAGCASHPAARDGGVTVDEDAAQALDVQASASTGVVRGLVVDQAIRPIPGANVTLQRLNRTAQSNAQGAFGFEGLRAGTYFLEVSHPRYTRVLQSVQVEAGVGRPPVVSIQLLALPTATPFVEAYKTRISSSFAVCPAPPAPPGCNSASGITDVGVLLGQGVRAVSILLSPNATVAQTEMEWTPQTPLAQQGHVHCSAADGIDRTDSGDAVGPSPLALRSRLTAVVKGMAVEATGYGCTWEPAPGTDVPVGAAWAQDIVAVTHVFHNLTPRADWAFSRDGDYPVPPRA